MAPASSGPFGSWHRHRVTNIGERVGRTPERRSPANLATEVTSIEALEPASQAPGRRRRRSIDPHGLSTNEGPELIHPRRASRLCQLKTRVSTDIADTTGRRAGRGGRRRAAPARARRGAASGPLGNGQGRSTRNAGPVGGHSYRQVPACPITSSPTPAISATVTASS